MLCGQEYGKRVAVWCTDTSMLLSREKQGLKCSIQRAVGLWFCNSNSEKKPTLTSTSCIYNQCCVKWQGIILCSPGKSLILVQIGCRFLVLQQCFAFILHSAGRRVPVKSVLCESQPFSGCYRLSGTGTFAFLDFGIKLMQFGSLYLVWVWVRQYNSYLTSGAEILLSEFCILRYRLPGNTSPGGVLLWLTDRVWPFYLSCFSRHVDLGELQVMCWI